MRQQNFITKDGEQIRWRRYAAKHECVGVSVPMNKG